MDNIIKWTNLSKVLEEYAVALRNEYQDNLIRHDHIAKGDLMNRVDYIIQKGNNEISVSLILEDYWKYVEYDTKPHFPPVDKIMEWIRVKPVLPRPDNNGKLPTERQLAYLIGRKINEEGTTGTHDLRDAQRKVLDDFEERVGEAITKDLSDCLTVLFSEFFTGK